MKRIMMLALAAAFLFFPACGEVAPAETSAATTTQATAAETSITTTPATTAFPPPVQSVQGDKLNLPAFANNGGLYVYHNGATYFRQYNADCFEEIGEWGVPREIPGTKKKMMRMDADGNMRELFDDNGTGGIFIDSKGNFYLCREGDSSQIYSLDTRGNVRWTTVDDCGSMFYPDRGYNSTWDEVPRPDYEFTRAYAKTPTHIFATRGGELYRMPLNNIAQQQKITLPKKFDNSVICGLTEEWLFVSGGRTTIDENSSYPRLLSTVTYRISLKTLKAEQVDEREADKSPGYGMYPRYNAAGNSLLYVHGHTVEALRLDTGKRSTAFDFNNYYLESSDVSRVSGWLNSSDGAVTLMIQTGWWGGAGTCLVFGEDNAVRVVDMMDIPRPTTSPEHAPSKAEQDLIKHGVEVYAACGDYVYYLDKSEQNEHSLFRIKADGSGKKLLRANADIFSLMAVNGKLCGLTGLQYSWDEGPLDFSALDENGKVTKTIASGFSGEWGWSTWERFGDLIMFNNYSVNGSEESLHTLYDPASGAVFMAQE